MRTSPEIVIPQLINTRNPKLTRASEGSGSLLLAQAPNHHNVCVNGALPQGDDFTVSTEVSRVVSSYDSPARAVSSQVDARAVSVVRWGFLNTYSRSGHGMEAEEESSHPVIPN